jgi:hypothetical protein
MPSSLTAPKVSIEIMFPDWQQASVNFEDNGIAFTPNLKRLFKVNESVKPTVQIKNPVLV